MKSNDTGETSRVHAALRAALKAGDTRPQFTQSIAPPIPILHDNNAPAAAGLGEGSISVGGPEAEAEHMVVDSDDIANHDFPIPPHSEHYTEGRVTEETGKLEEERVHPGGVRGKRKGDRQSLGEAPTIMDQDKTFASNDGDIEPRDAT